MLMMATPNFFVGLVFIYLFAIVFQILPSGGMYSSSGARTFGDLMKHMILPCLVLSFQQIGADCRRSHDPAADRFFMDATYAISIVPKYRKEAFCRLKPAFCL